jgi:glutathione S-transferase
VRQRLTELGLPFVAKQVPAARTERDELRVAAGVDTIPVLVDGGGVVIGAARILPYLDHAYRERPDAEVHRDMAAAKVRCFAEVNPAAAAPERAV